MNEPIKCSECGTWWRGEEHNCERFRTIPMPSGTGGNDFTVYCTCPKYPPNYIGDVLPNPNCPMHRYASTYTT